jgi:outer membrane protein W
MKKQLITTSLLTLTCLTTKAQETTNVKPKRFSTGIQTLIMNSPNTLSGADLHEFGVGFYGRYFLNKRIALKGSINYTFSENTFGFYEGLKRQGWDAPLFLEYHLSPGKKIRPFFGVGVGFSNLQEQYTFDNNTPYLNNSLEPYLQLAQGVTFDIGKKLQITQSLFYRYKPDAGQSVIGLSIGIGFKK